MLRGDDDVLHAGIQRELHPVVGLEPHRIELGGQLLVLANRNLRAVHDPLAEAERSLALPLAGGDRIQAPVNEEPVLRLAEPLQTLLARGVRWSWRGGLRARHKHERRYQADDNEATLFL